MMIVLQTYRIKKNMNYIFRVFDIYVYACIYKNSVQNNNNNDNDNNNNRIINGKFFIIVIIIIIYKYE